MSRSKWLLSGIGAAIVLLLVVVWLAGTLSRQGDMALAQKVTSLTVPSQFHHGEVLFMTHCASCHGVAALGTDRGPSLLWRIYAPNHHSDYAFYLAVQQGVRAHHWRFGNMPPLPHVTEDEMTQIIPYVRWLQQQVGVH